MPPPPPAHGHVTAASGSDELLVDLIDGQTASDPRRACLIFEDAELSYAEVKARSIALANGMAGRGIGRGTKVGVLSPNHPMCMVATLATLRAGATWVPMNPRDSIDDIARLLGRFDVDVLLYHSSFAADVATLVQVATVKAHACLETALEGEASYASWADGQSGHIPPPVHVEPDDTAALFATGGTTGLPKGVMFSHRRLAAFARHWSELGLSDGDVRRLAAAPLTHVAGRACIAGMASGVTTVVLERFDPATVLQAIPRHRITAFTAPPTLLYRLLAEPDVRTYDYSSLTTLGYGAAPIALPKLKEAIEVFGPVLTEGYGQTEAPMFIARMSAEEHVGPDGRLVSDDRLASCGRPTPFASVRVVDEEGMPLPAGRTGEIVVNGDFTMSGYYGDPEATAAAYFGDFLRTGDLGTLDAEGYLTIVGRRKDMIITGGFNVYPAEVEAALARHPGIHEAAVVGLPDELWGEAVVAFVQLRPGATVDHHELTTWIRAEVGGVKAPKRIEVVTDLPTNANGKVLKRVLVERISGETE